MVSIFNLLKRGRLKSEFLLKENLLSGGGGEGTLIHYLYGYVPPNGVVILKLLIWHGVSISEAFSRTGYSG